MNKAYERINWENYPSVETPLNKENLNKIDASLDEVDNRIISMDTQKVDVSTVNAMVKNVTFDETTGIFTVEKLSGEKITLDTKLEKLAVNFSYDATAQQLVINLDDGTQQYVDLSALITQYEFLDTDTVAFSIDSTGKVSAIVKNGSITEDKLQPNYLATIKVEVAKAQASQSAAEASATEAESYAVGGTGTRAGEDEDNAKYYCNKSKEYNDNIEKRVRLATFDVNDDGELIYTDNTANNFTVNDDGDLIWEVA